ncbi:MAG: WYL domain-containing protein [Oscillospiraceae bacterium]|nr:WYL domain-containing protein [Oscillospiraceae bacterium]
MNIFSELYGAYYRTAARILEKCEITEADIYKTVSEEAFADSALFLPRKLIPSNDFSDWGLLREKGNRIFASVLKHKPVNAVTELQKRWLKAQLDDPKFRLFYDNETLERLEERLKDVKPLYAHSIFRSVDVFSDGDPYSDENYINIFRTVVNAINSKEILDIEFLSGKNERKHGYFLPLRLEYSRKNDKFRIYCTAGNDRYWNGGLINMGRIVSAVNTHKKADGGTDINEYFRQRRCSEPAVVEVSSERNGIERFMMEFATYEKYTERDLKTGRCTVKLWYDKADETELLIRLLSFGPVLEIKSPQRFRQLAAERIQKQYSLLFDRQESVQ